MIFVTVGTHEQPFDRLVKAIDHLKGEKRIQQEVFIQTGYSEFKPEFCETRDFIAYEEMTRRMAEAEIVITHGGTGSIMLVLYYGKIPVVVPRQHRYGEHIDDHQVLFCRTMEEKRKIIAVYETEDLEEVIAGYRRKVTEQIGETPGSLTDSRLEERTGAFAQKLEDICLDLVIKGKRERGKGDRLKNHNNV